MDLRFQEVVYMPSNGEIIKDVVEQFQKVQSHMKNARKENAAETYEGLKKDYLSLKAVLTSLGVNLTDIDQIKE
jgi:iron uptake system EfeUOB component EfeO/EfeM